VKLGRAIGRLWDVDQRNSAEHDANSDAYDRCNQLFQSRFSRFFDKRQKLIPNRKRMIAVNSARVRLHRSVRGMLVQ